MMGVVVVGAGPAGLAAAEHALRAGPAGLAAAGQALRARVGVRVFDRRAGRVTHVVVVRAGEGV
ncbi:hypothetical protein ABJI51_11365 [Amycolatopsis sp. NEAU-NG30]|uniref:Uncharacterized protein n=1 Tax=Amycolatopsis melonis TaxID=3156488 RepID=A0ABV0LDW5_9PSEU